MGSHASMQWIYLLPVAIRANRFNLNAQLKKHGSRCHRSRNSGSLIGLVIAIMRMAAYYPEETGKFRIHPTKML
jgi:hypothetical protein